VGFILLEMKLLSYVIVKEDYAPAPVIPKLAQTGQKRAFPAIQGAGAPPARGDFGNGRKP
jgi:hypothetical protein